MVRARAAGWRLVIGLRSLPPLTTAEGRRAWAFVAIWCGCIVFTCMATWGMWLVRATPHYALTLALAAHVQLFVGMGAFGFVMGRRMSFSASRDGLEIDDREQAAAAAGAALATDAAQQVAEDLKS